ncbi:hypothetical protein COW09_01110 [bacterium (Candidatus Moisslbacteria) CG12_big_fil_rev_8_21_14_0_65_36_11]|nr:MAG: hypothetical protein COS23_01195 [bacterium (Candidatus Moisslbacteria) CG02_land_8_20_14_3_00_36_53]PIW67910.1 MAG: hypothetical protein COW09_01110 [bacterium (Candidatus Moisslbacteria) CG12_big_fil_rev_8_21_14_0_65_36_11]PIZ90407.1 MAG: hypothetical protein COX87_00645 [bacterium (Candidatus Moisslbacteria) CG_4_10_14_0_2_um_filter_36_61]PJC00867.1 MAG: hypothetical protein CO074_00355 [bacterium (Candidatus Moisslbacteria) CG_4_9_14_0_8_um_filter_36_20]
MLMLKEKIKKLFPRTYSFYRQVLANLAAFFYGWPGEKLIVIGITGTAGKSTAVNLIAKILDDEGFRVGLISGLNFKINKKEWPNTTRMTMPGPFYLQKLLHQMVEENCQYAVIETTSQGLVHQRHLGINYDLTVFLNLLPEHLESHGSFEKYKQAKGFLFEALSKKKKIINGREIKKIKIINLDDKESSYFLNFKSDLTYGYTVKGFDSIKKDVAEKCDKIISPTKFEIKEDGSEFILEGIKFKTNLLSGFNLYNSLSAIAVCLAYGLNLEKIRKSLLEVDKIPGRLEIITHQPFKVVIDYAHTPDELLGIYEFFRRFKPDSRIIAVFGSCGGGRDKWKREVLGEIASRFADEIILTNEDPYDEDPQEIIEQIAQGISASASWRGGSAEGGKNRNHLYKILDRREAIKKALSLARIGDIVLITGKGAEKSMVVKGGKKILWSDKGVVEKELGITCGKLYNPTIDKN